MVILSDTNMPGTDSLQLLGEIKQRRRDLPVMKVTAYGDDERRHASELGAFEFIAKPVDFECLKAQLRQLPATADTYRGRAKVRNPPTWADPGLAGERPEWGNSGPNRDQNLSAEVRR